jgi:hypothetical protein
MHETFHIGAAVAAVKLALSSAAFAQTTPGAEVGTDAAAGSPAASTGASDAPAATSGSTKRKPVKKMTRRQEANNR